MDTFGQTAPPSWVPPRAHDAFMLVGFHVLYLIAPLLTAMLPVFLLLSSSRWLQLLGAILPLAWISTFGAEKKLGSPWPAFASHPVWGFMLSWFPVTIQKPKDLDLSPERTYVFAVHPHGALAFNRAAFGFDYARLWKCAFPGLDFRVLTAAAAFRVPLIREFWLWTFCVDAGKATARRVLHAGKSILVYPGGEREQILTTKGRHILYLANRKGFVKLALETKSPLVPIYAFGDTDLYVHYTVGLRFRQWLVERFGVALPLISGSCGLLPFKRPVTLVVGRPLEPPVVDGVLTQADVDAFHARYLTAIRALFEAHKVQCGQPRAQLEIL